LPHPVKWEERGRKGNRREREGNGRERERGKWKWRGSEERLKRTSYYEWSVSSLNFTVLVRANIRAVINNYYVA